MSRDQSAPVSVVIATRGRDASLRRTLASIATQTPGPAEIIVVDDGSGLPLEDLGEGVILLRNEGNRGASFSRNRGIEVARERFVMFLDDDIEFIDPGAVGRALAWMERRPDCAMVAFRQIDANGTPLADQPARTDYPCLVGKFFSYACLGRRDVLVQVGGFDPDIPYYYEEVELGMRLFDAGHSIVFDPGLTVVHHRDPIGRDMRRIYRVHLCHACYATILRYPWWSVPVVIPRYMMHHVKLSRMTMQTADLGGVAQAMSSIARKTPHLLRRRKPVKLSTIKRMRRLDRHPEPLA